MELMYIRNRNGTYDSGYLSGYEVDFDISTENADDTNDFALSMPLPADTAGLLFLEGEISSIIYIDGTEYGGEILGSEQDIAENKITYTGRTWRGTLDQYIIEPPAGQDYLVVSGNLATILRALPMSSYIQVEDTTYSSGSFQFNRYIKVHEGARSLLANVDPSLRLMLSFSQTDGAYTGITSLSIKPANDISDLIEASQDYSDRIKLKMTYDHKTPRHLICLGQGELHEREVIHLYADADWNVSQTPIAGAYPVDAYDYSSSENLLSDGKKHYAELIANHRQIEVSVSDIEVGLGDIISAKNQLTGESIKAEISNIIYHCTDDGRVQTESYQYKTKVRI